MAPVRASIASRSVVLPLWKGPTSAMHRGPRGLLTSCPIAASSFGARPLIGSARWDAPPPPEFWQEGKSVAGVWSYVSRTRCSVLPATRRVVRYDAPQNRDHQKVRRSLAWTPDQQRTAIVRQRRA